MSWEIHWTVCYLLEGPKPKLPSFTNEHPSPILNLNLNLVLVLVLVEDRLATTQRIGSAPRKDVF